MQISLQRPAKKFALLGGALLLTVVYLALVSREFAAAHFASVPDVAKLRTAVRLAPSNAEYHQQLGRSLFLAGQDPTSALQAYQTAVRLNPYDANFWLGLASVEQVLGNVAEQEHALERAIAANPHSTNVAWEAANLYVAQGETEKAFPQFRAVLEGNPSDAGPVLRLCLRVSPDVDSILHQVLPQQPSAYTELMELLIAKNDQLGTARVWDGLLQLQQPFEQRYAFEYVNYLLRQREVEQAQQAWRQTADRFGLSDYLTSSDNLIVNANFDFDILNQGFDWHYVKQTGVSLILDASEFHTGRRSLSVTFEGPGVSDTGISQVIAVQPDTSYELSAFFKTTEIQGAGGPRFAVQDAYTQETFFLSDDLKNADVWREVGGVFKTGPETKLIVLHILRVPAGDAIRGKLWVGDFRLVEKPPETS